MVEWLRRLAARLPGVGGKYKVVTVPVVALRGTIQTGGRFGSRSLNLAGVERLLAAAFADKQAPCVALAINSPGGAPAQSELILRRVRDLSVEKNKPVLAFIEDMGASGGYMLALAGDEIFAMPSSIVGSIGVIGGGLGFSGLMDKLGVDRRIHTAGEHKMIMDPFGPPDDAKAARYQSLLDAIHSQFKALVRERRGTKLAKPEDELFNGSVWLGDQALEAGLIDGLGEIRSTLKARYGAKTRLKLLAPKRGFLTGLMGGGAEAMSNRLIDGAVQAIEERMLWSRFGL
jgi:signal peptide peptidase SppA